MSSLKFILTNINCDACVKVTQLKLQRIAGVKNVSFERHGNQASGIIESESVLTLNDLQAALAGTPYRVQPL